MHRPHLLAAGLIFCATAAFAQYLPPTSSIRAFDARYGHVQCWKDLDVPAVPSQAWNIIPDRRQTADPKPAFSDRIARDQAGAYGIDAMGKLVATRPISSTLFVVTPGNLRIMLGTQSSPSDRHIRCRVVPGIGTRKE